MGMKTHPPVCVTTDGIAADRGVVGQQRTGRWVCRSIGRLALRYVRRADILSRRCQLRPSESVVANDKHLGFVGQPADESNGRRTKYMDASKGSTELSRVRPSRTVVPLLMAMMLLLGNATGAVADYVYEQGRTHSSSTSCTDTRAETSHGSNGGGYWRADAISLYVGHVFGWGDLHCARNWDRPGGYLRAADQAYKWDSSQGKWVLCADTGWKYNTKTADRFIYSVNYGSSTPPCGSGYYGNHGWGQLKNNGKWYGGVIWSGYHWLPTRDSTSKNTDKATYLLDDLRAKFGL